MKGLGPPTLIFGFYPRTPSSFTPTSCWPRSRSCIQLRDDPGVPPATRLAAGRIVETVRDRTSAKRVTANDDGPLQHKQRLIKDAEALEAS